jgi:hypothetical protein
MPAVSPGTFDDTSGVHSFHPASRLTAAQAGFFILSQRAPGAAEERDELPPPHTDHGDFLPRAVSAPLAAPCSVCRTFSLPQKEPESP